MFNVFLCFLIKSLLFVEIKRKPNGKKAGRRMLHQPQYNGCNKYKLKSHKTPLTSHQFPHVNLSVNYLINLVKIKSKNNNALKDYFPKRLEGDSGN